MTAPDERALIAKAKVAAFCLAACIGLAVWAGLYLIFTGD